MNPSEGPPGNPPKTPLIAAVADDLTGVCDTGAQFSAAGLWTIGLVEGQVISADLPEVVIVNTQSRSMDEAAAGHCVKQAVTGLKQLKPGWFFKKIDTALRGNIATEVYAMMEVLEVTLVLYVAAIPSAGRTTVSGCQLFRGIPIKDSVHGEDRLNPNPIATSSNVELLSKIPGTEIEVKSLSEVRSRDLEISNLVRKGPKSGPTTRRKIIVFDSETDEDIGEVVKASMKIDPPSFFYVGSFGLSKALGKWLVQSRRIGGKQALSFWPDQAHENKIQDSKSKIQPNMLVVSGSSHPTAISQISHLDRRGMAEVVRFDPEDLMEASDRCVLRWVEASRTILNRQKGVVLTITEGRPGIKKQSRDLILVLAKLAYHVLCSQKIDVLVLVGGETGYGVCRAAGIEGIEILGSIASVTAYGRPLGQQNSCRGHFRVGKNPRVIVTKGGSLGEEDTLEKIFRFFGA